MLSNIDISPNWINLKLKTLRVIITWVNIHIPLINPALSFYRYLLPSGKNTEVNAVYSDALIIVLSKFNARIRPHASKLMGFPEEFKKPYLISTDNKMNSVGHNSMALLYRLELQMLGPSDPNLLYPYTIYFLNIGSRVELYIHV